MPQVTVQYDASIKPKTLQILAECLPGLVAQSLSCSDPDGQLLAHHVEVTFYEIGGHDVTNGIGLQITVDAARFPSRERNKVQRCKQIAKSIKLFIQPQDKAYVWLRLHDGAFVSINMTE